MTVAPLKICFMGCVEFSRAAIAAAADVPGATIVGVITRRASNFNADFEDLRPVADTLRASCLYADDAAQPEALADFIREMDADVVYCFGWSSLLPSAVLSAARLGVIGFHPAPLPRGRGRHPIIWALVLGLSSTASTFFYMTEEADDGDLISQRAVPILPQDDARALYERITKVALAQIGVFTDQLRLGVAPRVPQDHSLATNWRKRSSKDGVVDWRMPAEAIVDLVRALRPPYPGATFQFGKEHIVLLHAQKGPAVSRDIEPGRVLEVDGRVMLVKAAGTGSVLLLEHTLVDLPAAGTCL